MKQFRLFFGLILFISIGFGGCKIQKEFSAPPIENADLFSTQTNDTLSFANASWWEFFNDAVLEDLINQALTNNLPLKNIVIGIKQAQLQLNITRSQLYPAINYGLNAETSTSSLSSSFNNSINAVGQVSYTVDVWGRIANQNEAALQAYLATEMASFEVKATLVAQLAELYFTLRDIDNKIEVSEQMEASMSDYQSIMEARYSGGFISKVDLNQISISLKDIQVTLQALFRARKQVENAISLVLGNTPQFIPRGKKLQEQIFPSELPVGVPATLLRRRPSILFSEMQLKAQLAQIGAVEALQYPNFQINLNIGTELLNPASVFGNLLGSVTGPIFNAKRIENTISIEEEQYNRLVLDYEQAYLIAFQEVEDALIAIKTYKQEVAIRNSQLKLAEEAYDLAWVRYNEGATSILEFLNVQSNLYSVQLTASESYKSELQAVVQLYLALGGGW